MKNIVIVDIDTERKDQITIIGKPEGLFTEPKDKEEAKKMVEDDILSLCEGLITIINVAHDNEYNDASYLLQSCIKLIEDGVKTNK